MRRPGNLMRLAARILGGEDRFDDLAREAGSPMGWPACCAHRATRRGTGLSAADG